MFQDDNKQHYSFSLSLLSHVLFFPFAHLNPGSHVARYAIKRVTCHVQNARASRFLSDITKGDRESGW